MKRFLGVAAVLVLAASVTGQAVATVPCPVPTPCSPPCPVLFDWDANCYAYETSYSPATFISDPGSQLTVVGLITLFGPALPFLNPNDPNKEYTFVLSGLISKGTIVSVNGPTTNYDTDYDSTKVATFAVYEGSPRNAPSTSAAWAANPFGGVVVPANFQDGTLILSGELCGFHTAIHRTGGNQAGDFRGGYRPNGGTLFPFIPSAWAPLGGLWCPGPATVGGCTRPANYTAHPDGKFDASEEATPATLSTWGRLKQIYR